MFWKYAANLQENTYAEEHLWMAASGKSKGIFTWKWENDPAELADLSLSNKNVLDKNENFWTY